MRNLIRSLARLQGLRGRLLPSSAVETGTREVAREHLSTCVSLDLLPGTQSHPFSPSAARERPIPPLPLRDLLGWQCQAGRGQGEVLEWARGQARRSCGRGRPPAGSVIGPWEGRIRASVGTVPGRTNTLDAIYTIRAGPQQEPDLRSGGSESSLSPQEGLCTEGRADRLRETGGSHWGPPRLTP